MVLLILAVTGGGVLYVAAHMANTVMRFLRHFILLHRFLAGHPMDGKARTDSTFWQAPTKALHPTAGRSWWHWRPGCHRAAMRAGALGAFALVCAGLTFETALTLVMFAVCAAAGLLLLAWHVFYKVRNFRHERHYVRPLERTLIGAIAAAPMSLEVERDGDAVQRVAIEWAPETEIKDIDQDAVLQAVTRRLAIEAPVASWSLKGRNRSVAFTPSQPPPSRVVWADVEEAIRKAPAHDLMCGMGKQDADVSVSTTLDSPHFGLAMGTGGGKSNTAAFWLVQELMKGSVALILDAKYISHPWTFKDMDAEYGQLPNVAYARTTADLHNASVWLGVELQRRTEIAERHVNSKGDILGDVGPPLWIIAEELNLATPRLKQYWASVRDPETDPKRSPALDGIAAVSFAGRAVQMHLIVIGQMLTAASLGGGDVRENIGVRMLARYTSNSWKMQAGDLPMPPPSDIPGRVQVIASGVVREAQVPLMDMEQCRELALSGTVTRCPVGMPGVGHVVRVPLPSLPSSGGPEQPVFLGSGTIPGRPPGTLTLREAAGEGLFRSLDSARKAAQRYELEPAGREGSSHLYRITDLVGAVRGKRG